MKYGKMSIEIRISEALIAWRVYATYHAYMESLEVAFKRSGEKLNGEA
jgi:hypothetical protein